MNDAETTRVSRASVSPNWPQYFTVSTVHVAGGLCHAMRSNEFTLAREVRREILNFRFRFGGNVSVLFRIGVNWNRFAGIKSKDSIFKQRFGCCLSKLSSWNFENSPYNVSFR